MNSPEVGKLVLANLLLGANIQEFAQQVDRICHLLQQHQLTSEEAEHQIEQLFEQLQQSAQNLGIASSIDSDNS